MIRVYGKPGGGARLRVDRFDEDLDAEDVEVLIRRLQDALVGVGPQWGIAAARETV